MGRTIVQGFNKAEVARQVTALALDKGWKPVSRIQLHESFMHDGVAKYVCVLEKEGEDTLGIESISSYWKRKRKGKVRS